MALPSSMAFPSSLHLASSHPRGLQPAGASHSIPATPLTLASLEAQLLAAGRGTSSLTSPFDSSGHLGPRLQHPSYSPRSETLTWQQQQLQQQRPNEDPMGLYNQNLWGSSCGHPGSFMSGQLFGSNVGGNMYAPPSVSAQWAGPVPGLAPQMMPFSQQQQQPPPPPRKFYDAHQTGHYDANRHGR